MNSSLTSGSPMEGVRSRRHTSTLGADSMLQIPNYQKCIYQLAAYQLKRSSAWL